MKKGLLLALIGLVGVLAISCTDGEIRSTLDEYGTRIGQLERGRDGILVFLKTHEEKIAELLTGLARVESDIDGLKSDMSADQIAAKQTVERQKGFGDALGTVTKTAEDARKVAEDARKAAAGARQKTCDLQAMYFTEGATETSRVFFARGSTTLPELAQKTLNRLKGVEVTLVAYSTGEKNMKLARGRLDAVKQYLQDLKPPAKIVHAEPLSADGCGFAGVVIVSK